MTSQSPDQQVTFAAPFSATDLSAIAEALVPTILEAGAVVMDVYAGKIDVMIKDDQSPVTIADEKAEKIITKSLQELTPSVQIIGEEAMSADGAPVSLDDVFWLVDPLDGTKEFIKKGEDFTVNIGLIAGGEPILGLVFAPALSKLYWGSVDGGAFIADIGADGSMTKRPISTRVADPDHLVIVASKSHRSPELEAWLADFPAADHVSIGSSLKFCFLAEGAADLYPRLGPTCEWDTAAADAVLRAAGGIVLDPTDQPLRYGKDPIKFLNSWFVCKAKADFVTPKLEA